MCVTRAVRFLSARRRLRSKRNERQRKAFNNTMCSFFLMRRHTTTKIISLPFDFGGKVLAREKRSSSLLLLLLKRGARGLTIKNLKVDFDITFNKAIDYNRAIYILLLYMCT